MARLQAASSPSRVIGSVVPDKDRLFCSGLTIPSFEMSKTITSCRGGMLFINTNKINGIEKQTIYYDDVPEQSRKYSSNILLSTAES